MNFGRIRRRWYRYRVFVRRHLNWKRAILVLLGGLTLTHFILQFFFIVNYQQIPKHMLRRIIPGEESDRIVKHYRSAIEPSLNKAGSAMELRDHPRKQCRCAAPEGQGLTPSDDSVNSTCSSEATKYGLHQKVISYSFYLRYTTGVQFFLFGIEPNLDKIEKIFPGWLVRIYTDIPVNDRSCPFICKYQFLFWCDIKNIPVLGDMSKVNGRVWRYLSVGDPTVDIVIMRDLDSTVSWRERTAVQEWESAEQAVHVMRDSQWHNTEILAGLWGIKNYRLRDHGKDLQTTLMEAGRKNQTKFWDQLLAKKYIYNKLSHDLISHDSYFCTKFPDAVVRPFSTQRIGNEFVGHDDRKEKSRVLIRRLKYCPAQCRPAHGKHWLLC